MPMNLISAVCLFPDGGGPVWFASHPYRAVFEPARLVFWSGNISLNPSMAPAQFFHDYLPGSEVYDYDEHTVLVSFRAPRSNVIYPAAVNEEPWIWRDAVNEL